jgi:hypothetical protein
MKFAYAIAIVGSIFALSAASASACSCAGVQTPCHAFGEASAVFVGTVIENKFVRTKDGDFEHEMRSVRLSIDTPFRGVEGAEVEVTTGMGGGDCGFNFRQSQQYLVYAHAYEGKLSTSICSRTRLVANAQEDLTYLRGLPEAKPGVTISGKVVANKRNEKGGYDETPVAGATVTIEGKTNGQGQTDAKGQYRVESLPAGDYLVKLNVPEGLSSQGEPEEKLSLINRSCSVVNFWLQPDSQLSGRVLNPQGLPVSNAVIFLHEFDKERYQGHWDSEHSDKDGKYIFRRMPAGRYVLQIRFDGSTSQQSPFPTIYYPGVSEMSQAKVITIAEGQRVETYDLEVPALPLSHEVEGEVAWSNGSPASNVRVSYTGGGDPVVYTVKVDGQGRFSFKAYEGLKLSLRASSEPADGKSVFSEWANITVTSGLPPIKLVLPAL